MTNADIVSEVAEQPAVVLVVEDEALVRLVVCEALREQGFTVIEAASAEEAQAVLASNLPVDVVFTDMHMPGAFDGVELVRRLRLDHPNLPVLATSGHLDRAYVGDVAGYFPKPYRLAEVVAAVFGLVSKEQQA